MAMATFTDTDKTNEFHLTLYSMTDNLIGDESNKVRVSRLIPPHDLRHRRRQLLEATHDNETTHTHHTLPAFLGALFVLVSVMVVRVD